MTYKVVISEQKIGNCSKDSLLGSHFIFTAMNNYYQQKNPMLDSFIFLASGQRTYQNSLGVHTLFHTKCPHRNTRIIAAIHLRPHLQKEAVTGTARKPTSLWRSLRKCDFKIWTVFKFRQPFSLYSQEVAGLPALNTIFLILGFPYNCYGFGISRLIFCIA